MNKWLLFFLLAGFTASAQKIKVAELKQQEDSLYFSLMQSAQPCIGSYNQLVIFHHNLLNQEVPLADMPYRVLDSLFLSITRNAQLSDALVVGYSSAKKQVSEKLGTAKKVKGNSELTKQHNRLITTGEEALIQLNESATYCADCRAQYDSICRSHNIRMIMVNSFADTIGVWLIHMQDSLVEQGRVIAKLRQKINSKYNDKKSEPFWNEYNKLSVMEALTKSFQEKLLQLENAQSRFYDANNEAFFFTGPHIRKIPEVMATEDIVVQLLLAMADFREKEKVILNMK